jgi:hypothetical protein
MQAGDTGIQTSDARAYSDSCLHQSAFLTKHGSGHASFVAVKILPAFVTTDNQILTYSVTVQLRGPNTCVLSSLACV